LNLDQLIKDCNKQNRKAQEELYQTYKKTLKLNDKFGLDINPLFKYYLSTFKENGDAKPYSFSLQTGVNYKF
jgi:hypothetical protein